MATETIQIAEFAVETATSIKDLKLNISALKKEMEGLTIGSEEYSEVLTELQKNQTALKNAMHATTVDGQEEGKTLEGIAKAANGLGTSYNALVKRMADLTQEFRATEDAAHRANLAGQIREINDQLKEMDAVRGNFQRNVGNYVSHWEGLGNALRSIPPTLGPLRKQMGDIGQTMGMISKQPLLSIIGLLAPLIVKITSELKDNQTALDAVKKGMQALEPVFDFVEKILEKIAGWFAKVVDWLVEFSEQHKDAFKSFVSGAVGVGNAILQFILTPIRNTIDAAKALGTVVQDVFKGNFKQAAQNAKQAAKDIGENFKKGFDFKGNFEAGKAIGEEFIAGLGSTRKKAKDAGRAITEATAEGMLEGADAVLKALAELDRKMDAERARQAQLMKETDAMLADAFGGLTDEIDAQLQAQLDAEWNALQEEKRIKQERIDTLMSFASTLSNVTSAVADIYEADSDANEEAAKKAKAFRTAAAIIDTISGAIAAYRSTIESIPAPANMVLAPLNAAAVLAAGYAQVKQINAVKIGSGDASSTPAIAQAPSFSPSIQQMRSVTGRSEEERLNRMADDSRVYLVYSDLEIANTHQRVRVRETEF